MSDIVHKIAQTKRGGNDKVFDEDMKPKDFVFDEKVASVFDDMVSRSVPMYKETMAAAMGLAKTSSKIIAPFMTLGVLHARCCSILQS